MSEKRMTWRIFVWISMLCIGCVRSAFSQDSTSDLTNLSLEDLMNVRVSSVSRKPQSLASAPAAVFVIRQDDIRRSGASALPDVLRLVPGLQVARYSNSKWSVGVRGMGGYYSPKLLVLIDGRSVYTPDFAGIYWDLQELPLDQIDRIEVIRGPGGTMWGANAFNGVINIITKSASETPGSAAVVSGGTDDRTASFRFGNALHEHSAYRVYASGSTRSFETSEPIQDSSGIMRGGFRFDHEGNRDALTFQGDVYHGNERNPLTQPQLTAPYASLMEDHVKVDGANILGRWTRTLSSGGNLSLKAYFDRNVRNEYIHNFWYNATDVDFQHRLHLGERNDVVWGAGYRRTVSDIEPSAVMRYEPGRSVRNLFSAFAQDEIQVGSELQLTLGGKVEQHQHVGASIQPNLRAIWTPTTHQRLWGAVSHAVRTPSLADEIATFPFAVIPPSAATLNLPVEIQLVGDPNKQHFESVVAYEAGYRVLPMKTVSIDVAAFHNEYDHLTSYSRGPASLSLAGGVPHLALNSTHANLAEGESHGLETVVNWTPVSRWSLSGSSTLLRTHLRMADPTINAGNSLVFLSLNPRVQFTARSMLQLTRQVDFDATFYSSGPWQRGDVAGYSRTDLRTGWKVNDAANVDVGVQNLFNARHKETALYLYETATEIRRSAYARLTLRF